MFIWRSLQKQVHWLLEWVDHIYLIRYFGGFALKIFHCIVNSHLKTWNNFFLKRKNTVYTSPSVSVATQVHLQQTEEHCSSTKTYCEAQRHFIHMSSWTFFYWCGKYADCKNQFFSTSMWNVAFLWKLVS